VTGVGPVYDLANAVTCAVHQWVLLWSVLVPVAARHNFLRRTGSHIASLRPHSLCRRSGW